MNITDIQPEKAMGDKLEAIFSKQKELIDKYSSIEKWEQFPVNIHTRVGQKIIRDHMWRIVEELGEAANCLKNKGWKQTEMPTDEDHFYEEMSDALHFFIELLIFIGLDANSTYDLYQKKQQVNKWRIDTKY